MKQMIVCTVVLICGLAIGAKAADEETTTNKIAYMGVGTMPVSAVLGAQLALPAGMGLAVEYLDPDGTVGDKLKKHDILHKLDDQLLVSQRQLAVLVRMHAPGDTVTLTVIREGKPRAVKIALGEQSYQDLEHPMPHIPRFQFPSPGFKGFSFGSFDHEPGKPQGKRPQSSTHNHSSTGSYSLMDDGNMATLTVNDGRKHLYIRKKDGTVLFDGPINTEEEREKVPEDLRGKLKALEKNADR